MGTTRPPLVPLCMLYISSPAWGGGYISLPINFELKDSIALYTHRAEQQVINKQPKLARRQKSASVSTHTCTIVLVCN